MSEKPRDNADISLEEFMEVVNETRMKRHKESQKISEEVLTLRDRFALASVSYFLTFDDKSYIEVIRQAYEFADAALEVRNESI